MNTRRTCSFLPKKQAGTAAQLGLSAVQQGRDCFLTMDIFRDLESETMAPLEPRPEVRSCRKGQILYSQEDQAEVLFLLKSGRIQLYRLTPAGKRLELSTIEPGTFFGEMPWLGESLRHTFAEACEDSLLCVLSRLDVERLMLAQPYVALRMIEVLGQRIALCEARMEEMAYRNLPARIAAVLLRLSQGQGNGIVPITHQELGDMIGALRESVTKVLDEFKRVGLVELNRGRITLRDVAGLRSLLEE